MTKFWNLPQQIRHFNKSGKPYTQLTPEGIFVLRLSTAERLLASLASPKITETTVKELQYSDRCIAQNDIVFLLCQGRKCAALLPPHHRKLLEI